MFYQNFDKKISIIKKVGEKRLQTRLERNKQKRYEFMNNRRFGRNDEWSECSDGYNEDISEDENDSFQMSQTDIIRVFFTSFPSPQFESSLKNAVNNTFKLFESMDKEFDDMIEINKSFFAVELLNKMASFVGANISYSLQVQILKMIKELIIRKALDEVLIRNIEFSFLALKLVQLIKYGDEELVEQSIAVIQELMNNSNQLIDHFVNCGYINALSSRVIDLKWKTCSRISILNVREKQKFNRFARNQIEIPNNNKINANTTQKLPRILSRALLILLNTRLNQMPDFAAYLTPLIDKFITCPDDGVKLNALTTLLMLDLNNDYIIDIIITNFSHYFFYLIANSQDSQILIQVIHLFTKIIETYTKVAKPEELIIRIVNHLNKLLIKNSDAKVVKEVINCITTIAESLPSNSRLFFELCDPMIQMIGLLLRLTDKLKIVSYYAIKKVIERYSAPELEHLFRNYDLMSVIEQMLITNCQNCQMNGLEITSYICKTFSNTNESLMASLKCLLSRTGVCYALERFSLHNNKDISEISEHILKTYIDYNHYQSEDTTLLPVSDGKQYIFG